MTKNRHWELLKPPLLELHQNKCLSWLLPCLNIPGEKLKSINHRFGEITPFEILRKFGFSGIYWDVPCLDNNYPNSLFLIFSPSKEILFGDFPLLYKFFKELCNFKSIYDLDVGLICIVLEVESKYKMLINYVKKGEYSKIDINLAQRLYTGFKNGQSFQKTEFLIVKKSENYRKKLEEELNLPEGYLEGLELAEKPKRINEVFTYERKIRI